MSDNDGNGCVYIGVFSILIVSVLGLEPQVTIPIFLVFFLIWVVSEVNSSSESNDYKKNVSNVKYEKNTATLKTESDKKNLSELEEELLNNIGDETK